MLHMSLTSLLVSFVLAIPVVLAVPVILDALVCPHGKYLTSKLDIV